MCSRSQAIERKFDVVIETELDPERVRFAFIKYKRGSEEVSLEKSELLDKKLLLALARISSLEATPRLRKVDRSSGWRSPSLEPGRNWRTERPSLRPRSLRTGRESNAFDVCTDLIRGGVAMIRSPWLGSNRAGRCDPPTRIPVLAGRDSTWVDGAH
jgi:hypothetical protein